MKKKKSVGFWSSIFHSKSHSGCCNIQFEEVSNDNSVKEKSVENIENNQVVSKETTEGNEQNNSCNCNCSQIKS